MEQEEPAAISTKMQMQYPISYVSSIFTAQECSLTKLISGTQAAHKLVFHTNHFHCHKMGTYISEVNCRSELITVEWGCSEKLFDIVCVPCAKSLLSKERERARESMGIFINQSTNSRCLSQSPKTLKPNLEDSPLTIEFSIHTPACVFHEETWCW